MYVTPNKVNNYFSNDIILSILRCFVLLQKFQQFQYVLEKLNHFRSSQRNEREKGKKTLRVVFLVRKTINQNEKNKP